MHSLRAFLRGLIGFFRAIPELLRLLFELPLRLCQLLVYLCRHGVSCLCPRCDCRGVAVPPEIYKRPDPMLYSQQWLMSQGLAVTWDNPDIQLYRDNAPVASHLLERATEYEVRVRIWNNSYDAPAPALPVDLRFYGFGAGTSGTFIGQTYVDLGAKGTAQCPVFASFLWKTPEQAGHYCLQAKLIWDDDANPNNNLGQENTTVGTIHSPVSFNFRVKNNASVRRRFFFEVDDYTLPQLELCRDDQPARRQQMTRLRQSRERWKQALASQAYGRFSDLPDWTIHFEPERDVLAPREEIGVKVAIEPKTPGFKSRKAFNVHVFASPSEEEKQHRQYIGGVTLYVES
ncbi:MAG: hypothetical protein ABI540_10560 [Spartobacteria bacterium]